MTSSFDPRGDYERQRAGEPLGQFEVDARRWESPLLLVADVPSSGPTLPTSGRVTIDVTKPDPRLTLALDVAFCPFSSLVLSQPTPYGTTVSQRLALSTAWVSLLTDMGGDFRSVEDVMGTSAAPVSFIAAGLWGATWEVDVDVVAVRARIDFQTPGVSGPFYARARWAAKEPMSQRDWEHARQNMRLSGSPVPLRMMVFAP